jgi:hypothetical protein
MTSAYSALKWALFKFQKTEVLMLAKKYIGEKISQYE